MTAGDLIRRELENGATALGLAKRLAGSNDDTDPEVKRWRYTIMRAARGSEPTRASAEQVGRAFGEEVEPPQARPALSRLERRLEEGLSRAADILENQDAALATQNAMLDELRVLADELQAVREALESAGVTVRTGHGRSR